MAASTVNHRWKPALGIFCMFLGVTLIIQSTAPISYEVSRQLSSTEDIMHASDLHSWVNTTKVRKKNAAETHESLPFFVGLLSSMALKLTSSIDDVVWLVPFLIIPDQTAVMRNMVIYSWVCLFQTILALAISTGGIAALDAMNKSGKGWSSEKMLSFFAGMSLLVYGGKLFYEWYEENYGDGGDDDDEEKGVKSDNEEDKKLLGDTPRKEVSYDKEPGTETGGEDGQSAESKKRTASALFVVAFLGSLDDLTLFVPMLVGQALTWEELVLGSMIAVGFILVLCVFLGMCKPVADCLESIPLFAIVLVFGTFLTVKAIFFTD